MRIFCCQNNVQFNHKEKGHHPFLCIQHMISLGEKKKEASSKDASNGGPGTFLQSFVCKLRKPGSNTTVE